VRFIRVPFLWLIPVLIGTNGQAADSGNAAANFHAKIKPLLTKYCFDCHADGVNKGRVAFDEFANDAELLAKRELWLAALKNVRAGVMPPLEEDNPRPTPAEIAQLSDWIKFEAFGLDPAHPDPGRVTVKRLNRVEYRNTIRDLMGIDFNSEVEFPSDDTGNGFDNIADVLTISPLLLEKYLQAAEVIVETAVPKVAALMAEQAATGKEFRGPEGNRNGEQMSVTQAAKVFRTFSAPETDTYRVAIELEAKGSFDFDPGRCQVICRIDGAERFSEEVRWEQRKTIRHQFDVTWSAGKHVVSFEIVPLAPMASRVEVKGSDATQTKTRVEVRIASVQVQGPLSERHWRKPANHARFFPKGPAPSESAARDQYARELLDGFALRAFRRPVDAERVDKLVRIARHIYERDGKTFEEGIGRAMMAVLASPRFIFRLEPPAASDAREKFPWIDEYALASRLSYFLWSTMPDDELFRRAAQGALRRELQPQVTRMLADPRAQGLVRNFTGQWLQARDVEFVPINARAVLGLTAVPNKDGRVEFDSALRKLMRAETEMFFSHLLTEDRSVLELINGDYTFLNERLAKHYGVPNVVGDEMRLVKLAADSPRGGVLTQGTVLAVTSNPTRTSPVKRGLFILENFLGTPPPPPPPDVPALEEAQTLVQGRKPTPREMLAAHAADKLCHCCHARMDPLGFGLENFNALGGWRDTDEQQPIEVAGRLITGEKFENVRALKQILANDRRTDFYHCLSEKLFTYALGRGVEYYDTPTIDELVERLHRESGRLSVLILGIIESAAFQKERRPTPISTNVSLATPPSSSANPN